ncbi:MAG: DNA recombination protein RmuC [Candidatus Anoxychlamydiales bacterium]|nr:DNA recombination protein RmuC [Candidatus Anoxychlamydiales bacterium]
MYLFIAIYILLIALALIWMKISLKKTKDSLQETFKSISFDVMQKNNQAFMDLANANFDKYHQGFKSDIEFKQKELEKVLAPVKESIDKIDAFTKDVENKRHSAYSALNEQIKMLLESENFLRQETANLSRALKSPNIRGSWGQMHLKRVVELAGLLNNCDFYEQQSQVKDDKVYRPDLVIKLPGSRQIIVDAKTPIDAYLESQDQRDDNKVLKLKSHALNLKKHVNELSSKEYFSKFDSTPEFVILFLPAEAFLSSAIQIDPTIIEMAASKNIIIATPTTLIAILKTIAHIWKEDSISKNVADIAKTGRDLYDRLHTMNTHFFKLGKNLSTSVDAYNQAIASLNTRVMVSAEKLKDLSVSNKETKLEQISKNCNMKSIENV